MNYDKFFENYNFTQNTKIAAVIGDPIGQSLSPHLHNYLLKKHYIDGIYIPLKITVDGLAEFLKSLSTLGFSGCNVTIPHKEAALKLCDRLSESALAIGAVNTIVVDDQGKLFGDNSDGIGFINNIKTTLLNTCPSFNFSNKKVTVLGSGGAARAIVFALIKEGVTEINIVNRQIQKAENLINDFKKFKHNTNLAALYWDSLGAHLPDTDLLVNTTPLGMKGQGQLVIDLTNLKKSAIVCDIVYKPLMTELLLNAQKQGLPIVTGIGMLIYQGLVGFEAWFKTKPIIDQKLIDELTKMSSL